MNRDRRDRVIVPRRGIRLRRCIGDRAPNRSPGLHQDRNRLVPNDASPEVYAEGPGLRFRQGYVWRDPDVYDFAPQATRFRHVLGTDGRYHQSCPAYDPIRGARGKHARRFLMPSRISITPREDRDLSTRRVTELTTKRESDSPYDRMCARRDRERWLRRNLRVKPAGAESCARREIAGTCIRFRKQNTDPIGTGGRMNRDRCDRVIVPRRSVRLCCCFGDRAPGRSADLHQDRNRPVPDDASREVDPESPGLNLRQRHMRRNTDMYVFAS